MPKEVFMSAKVYGCLNLTREFLLVVVSRLLLEQGRDDT